MNYKFLVLIVLLVFSEAAYSQKKLGTKFDYKVTYSVDYSLDSTDLKSKKSEDMVLFLSNDISSFSSKSKLYKNTVIVKGNSAQTSKESLTAFPYVIIKNPKNNFLAYTLQIVDDYFYYKQNLDLFNWKLHSETKTIKDYNTQKATTTYAGRDYTAWFTKDIPISDGPFKFNGLPGLILEISDSENHYNYKIKSFEKLKPSVDFEINLKQYVSTDREKLFEVWYRYREDPFKYANNPNVKMSAKVHQEYVRLFTEMLEKENNRIEKN